MLKERISQKIGNGQGARGHILFKDDYDYYNYCLLSHLNMM
jgi:hypothetical protein